MKIKILLTILLPFYNFGQVTNEKVNVEKVKTERVNPKHTWFFGIEMGPNYTDSFKLEDQNVTFQVGFLTEYYIQRKISVLARLKYFNTGLSYVKDAYTRNDDVRFDAKIIAIPINIKYENSISSNEKLVSRLMAGFVINKEIESNYIYKNPTYAEYVNTSKTVYPSINLGMGLGYFISKQLGVYVDYEFYKSLEEKGISEIEFFNVKYRTASNHMLNFGVKYSFKK